MFLIPLTLQDIAPLKDPSERVTLPERELYERGLQLIDQGSYDGDEFTPVPFSLLLHWNDEKRVTVKIVEERPQGPLKFTCSRCLENGRQARTCEHQWASFVLLWRCLALETDELQPKELEGLAAKVREVAEGVNPAGISPLGIEELRNAGGRINAIRVDSKVVQETDTDTAKGDEAR